jgi:hypothetical protein
MKMRSGFVSNSSSSSFVFALETNLTAQSLAEQVWGDRKPPFGGYEMAQTIVDDLMRAIPLSDEDAASELGSGWWDDSPKTDDFEYVTKDGNRRINWDAYIKARDQKGADRLAKLKEKFPGARFYVLEYSDNDGERQSQLEHEFPWNKLDFVTKISHH